MRRRALFALVLGAFLARVVLPAFHVHEEGGRGGECHHEAEHHLPGPVAEAAHPECALCELLAVKVPGLVPDAPPAVEPSGPSIGERPSILLAAPRSTLFSLPGAPRGPPPPSPA